MIIMQQFDLKRALAGDPVIDNSGSPAIFLTSVANKNIGAGHYFKLRAGTDYEEIYGFDNAGCPICPSFFQYSLHMAPIKKTLWVNVWANGYGIILSSPKPYDSEKHAKDAYVENSFQVYHGAHPIEIEI